MRVGRIMVVAAMVALAGAFAGSAAHAGQPRPWPSESSWNNGNHHNWHRSNDPTTPAPRPSGGAETGGGGSHGVTVAGVSALALAGGAGMFLFLHRRRDELV